VVADGLTVVEPVAVVEVKVPGSTAIVLALLVLQLKVLAVPGATVAGLAENEPIVGAGGWTGVGA
jgi:hypothetical protein